jgi:hypothetical protein
MSEPLPCISTLTAGYTRLRLAPSAPPPIYANSGRMTSEDALEQREIPLQRWKGCSTLLGSEGDGATGAL